MSQPEVTVKNETPQRIWVIIAEERKHVIERKTRTVGETDFETYYHIMLEGKAALPIEGVPIEVSGKESEEFKLRLKKYWEDNKEAKYEWSQFIEPGELEIAPGKQNRWARKADEPIYYISIRTTQGKTLADSVARQDATITVDRTGHIADEIPEKIVIGNNAPVFFQKQGESNFVGDPQTANNNWDAGTFGNTGGSHMLVSDGGELKAGASVRIVSNSRTLYSKQYKYMYSTETGNVYYDELRASGKRAGKKQLWKIAKTNHKDNSSGDLLHYEDRVKVSSGFWPKANLGVNGKWLQCVNDDPAIWILREEPKG